MFRFGASRLSTADCLAEEAHALAFSHGRFSYHVCVQQIHPQSALIFVVAGLLPSRRNHPVPCRRPLLASFGPDVQNGLLSRNLSKAIFALYMFIVDAFSNDSERKRYSCLKSPPISFFCISVNRESPVAFTATGSAYLFCSKFLFQ